MRKLRWLGKIVQKMTLALSEPVQRLVRDWVVGSIVAGSVVLSAIARARRSDKRGFEATLERLSRGLGWQNSEEIEQLGIDYLRRVRPHTRKDFPVVAIDLSDIVKPYARKMPYLCEVHDGSASTRTETVIGLGWWLVEVVAVDDRHRVLPLARRAFSQVHPTFKSEADEVRQVLERVVPHLAPDVWAVLDRGFDGGIEFKLLDGFFAHWCVRQRGDRNVYLPQGDVPMRMSTLAKQLRHDERARIRCVRDGELVQEEERFGYCTIEVPTRTPRDGRRKPPCVRRTLISVHRDDPLQPPMMLLVNRPVRSAGEAQRWIDAYRRRWAVEEQTRLGKQSVQLENLRVLRWDAINNLLALAVLTEGLLALQQVEAPRRAARLARLAPIDGEVPPFAMYRIWMSVAFLLGGRVLAAS
ncbi:MAG: hypothetical protein HYY06_09635 [Deltaproteobacteria bacterium]|nr:hypothetical protein [Deltaproteobacteria bacterium]